MSEARECGGIVRGTKRCIMSLKESRRQAGASVAAGMIVTRLCICLGLILGNNYISNPLY